eukprot:gene5299-5682_t
MALPLWEECAWLKSVTTLHHRKFLIEKDRDEKERKEKELEAALKRKEEMEAENYRKQIEQNEKLLKLTSALLAPAPSVKKGDSTEEISAVSPPDIPETSERSSLFDGPPSKSGTKKKSLFDDDEEDDLFSSKSDLKRRSSEGVSDIPLTSTESIKTELVDLRSSDKEIQEETNALEAPPKTSPDHTSVASEEVKIEPPKFVFHVDDEINQKIFLYMGPGYKIPCDALIVGQNEQLSDRNDDNNAIVVLGGPRLEEQLAAAAPIQTGESVITEGGSLPTNWVIHAVGPRYDERYLTAAEHSLFSAYKSSLVLAVENNAKDLVITCIYSPKKKYPRFDAAHVALRTVRKFLQHSSVRNCFNRIMFCVPSQDDYEIYSALLAAYFPRNEGEMIDAFNLLPKELGDDWGEIRLVDRELKVSAGPKPLPQQSIMEYRRHSIPGKAKQEKSDEDLQYEDFGLGESSSKKKTGDKKIIPVGERPKAMTTISHNEDEIRKARVARELSKLSREERLKLRFQVLLEDVAEENLEDMETYKFLEFIGNDDANRTVVLLTVANLGMVPQEDEDRVLLYVMKLMEAFRCRPFVLIFAYSNVTEDNSPSLELMLTIFDLFAARYQENMQQFYVLHASFMARMYLWTSVPVLSNPYWSKYICAGTIAELGKYMNIDNLKWPRVIIQHDKHNT